MSTRKITKQQFADDTLLDTEGIDDALSDTFESLNNIGPDVDVSSMIQKQFVWGQTPTRWDVTVPLANNEAPWLPAVPNISGLNERLKSNDPYGVSTISPIGIAAKGWVWQTSFWTEDPIVVTDLDVIMHMNQSLITDHPYYMDPFDCHWNVTVPSKVPYPLEAQDPVEDIVVSLTVDSPHNQQVASQVSLVIHKNFFAIDSQRMLETDTWQTSDMVPQPTNLQYARGFWIQAKEVNAPIPAKSRVRINIFIPDWTTVQGVIATPINNWVDGGAGRINMRPWGRTLWSSTLTYLERK